MGQGFRRRALKRPDYLLRYTRDFTIAVVEAKATYKAATNGVQQAKQYAEMLGLRFAYATNGREIVEIDYNAGKELPRTDFPIPAELWRRYRAGRGIADTRIAERLLTPANHRVGQGERYYEDIAIHRAVEAILLGK